MRLVMFAVGLVLLGCAVSVHGLGGCPDVRTLSPPLDGALYVGATKGRDSFASDCTSNGGGTSFFKFSPVLGTTVNLSTCHGQTNFDTVVAVFVGEDCDHLTCVFHNDDVGVGENSGSTGYGEEDSSTDGAATCSEPHASYLTFLAEEETYWVMVGGYGNTEGEFGINIETVDESEREESCWNPVDILGPYFMPVVMEGDIDIDDGDKSYQDIYTIDEFENSEMHAEEDITEDTVFPAVIRSGVVAGDCLGDSRALIVSLFSESPGATVQTDVTGGEWVSSASADGQGIWSVSYGRGVDDGLGGFDATAGGLANAIRVDMYGTGNVTVEAVLEDMDGDAVPFAREYYSSEGTVDIFLRFNEGVTEHVELDNLRTVTISLVFLDEASFSVTGVYGVQMSGPDDLVVACHIPSQTKADWYRIFPQANALTTVTTCSGGANFDTILQLVTGSTLTFTPTNEHRAYYIAVAGYGRDTGSYTLTISQEDVLDDVGLSCDAAIPLALGQATSMMYNDGLVYSNLCGLNVEAGSKWFSYEAVDTTRMRFSTCAPFTELDTVMAVVSDCQSLACIIANDDGCQEFDSLASTVEVNVTEGTTYYIFVSGYGSGEGEFMVTTQEIVADDTV